MKPLEETMNDDLPVSSQDLGVPSEDPRISSEELPVSSETLVLSSEDFDPWPEEAVDTDRARRPGNPKEHEPAPIANAHWLEPDQQPAVPGVLVDPSRKLSATFGTRNPPRGLSGVLRRAAYQVPDYRARRWAILMFADRVDALESRLAASVRNPVTWLVIAGSLGILLQLRWRRRPRRFALL